MNQTKINSFFNYHGKDLRTFFQNDEIWFVAKDVCEILEISDTRKSVNLLDEDERNITPVMDAMGRRQETFIINEPGLYSLVLKSRKPEAKQF
jgi:prophage antirepressor-like protein